VAKLKRETIICNTNTLFQNKLSEVLYEDSPMMMSKGLCFTDENKALINLLKDHNQKF
jgi:hypothetical protein